MSGKNVLFSSIFDLTRLCYRLGQGLEAAGHRVFWTTTSRNWHNWLLGRGVDGGRILRLLYTPADFVQGNERDELTCKMVSCETSGELTFNQTLLMDRFVARLRSDKINEYLLLYYRDLRNFIEANRIDVVFGEPTNLNELVTCMVCHELGIPFYNAGDMRYPSGRVVFTEGYLQDRLVATRSDVDTDAGPQFLNEFRASRKRPAYFDHWNRQPVTTLSKLLASLRRRVSRGELVNQPNLTHHTITERASLMARRSLNGFYLRHIASYDKLADIRGKIAFYGLHVQPESSIDVRGSYFSDQIKLIKDIRRALPFDTTLVVKEHPNFLGIRGVSYFREIRGIPNVALVHHDVSAFDILEKCDVVFTVSGTIAYEAGMLGIPAVVFSPMYFDRLSTVHYCAEITRLKRLLSDIRGTKQNLDDDGRAMSELIAASFPGRWADPFNYPSVMDDDNIKKLETAFLRMVAYERR